MFMALLYRQSQHSEIEAWTEQALSLAEASSNIGEKLCTLNRLAQYFMFMGDSRKTMLVMNSSQQLVQSRETPNGSDTSEKGRRGDKTFYIRRKYFTADKKQDLPILGLTG
jgi:hypothetical protein